MKKKLSICFIFTMLMTSVGICDEISLGKLQTEMKTMHKTINTKIRTCTPYVYSGDTFAVHVLGKRNKKCVYRFFANDTALDCAFTTSELKNYKDVDQSAACTPTQGKFDILDKPLVDVLFK